MIDKKSLEEWKKNYSKYIQFGIECLPHSYQHGGKKFHIANFPSFKEFESYIGTDRDYTQYFFCIEYGFDNKPDGFHNKLHCQKRPDMHIGRVYYSLFMGVKWNYKIERYERSIK